jgi:hypothetical protein
MLEAEDGHEMAKFESDAAVIFASVTSELEPLRYALPGAGFEIRLPEVPIGFGFVGAVGAAVFPREGDDRSGIGLAAAKVVLKERSFRSIDRANDKVGESRLLG